MPRPRRCRRIRRRPDITYFKPRGARRCRLEEIILKLEEYEALRLKDLEGLPQSACAKKMGISQPTFHRLVTEARKKTADAVSNGKALRIEGGVYKYMRYGRFI